MQRRNSGHIGTVSHVSRHAANSSAFSASANPDEDWTKITDLAERRRIQNRIAQRNYRKKLKRRLEDLEKRAKSTSPGPEPSGRDFERSSNSPRLSAPVQRRISAPSPSRQLSEASSNPDLFQPQALLQHDDRTMFSQQYGRQVSASPPPFSYPAFHPVDPLSFNPYLQQPNYSMPVSTTESSYYSHYLSPPLSTSGTQFYNVSDAPPKREILRDGDYHHPFDNMICPSMRSAIDMEMPSSQSYSQQMSAPHTPPDSEFFEESIDSPFETDFQILPTTPPASPPYFSWERDHINADLLFAV